MTPEQIRDLYDRGYAESYNQRFLESAATAPDAEYEAQLLGSLLSPGARWLDVACGTGFFLRRFPHVERTGIDLSPEMLAVAARENPNVTFREHDFRDAIPEWTDRFDLVTCMWYAYNYVDSLNDLTRLLRNLADWTAPGGTCVIPLADPELILQQPFSGHDAPLFGGSVSADALIWTYAEADAAKVHRHLLAPTVRWMTERLAELFEDVRVDIYPQSPAGSGRRSAAVAARKRAR